MAASLRYKPSSLLIGHRRQVVNVKLTMLAKAPGIVAGQALPFFRAGRFDLNGGSQGFHIVAQFDFGVSTPLSSEVWPHSKVQTAATIP